MSQRNMRRNFQRPERRKFQPAEITTRITTRLREAVGSDRNAAKTIARAVGANVHTVNNWLEGRNAPSIANFIELANAYPELRAEARRLLALESDLDPEMERTLLKLMDQVARMKRGGA